MSNLIYITGLDLVEVDIFKPATKPIQASTLKEALCVYEEMTGVNLVPFIEEGAVTQKYFTITGSKYKWNNENIDIHIIRNEVEICPNKT